MRVALHSRLPDERPALAVVLIDVLRRPVRQVQLLCHDTANGYTWRLRDRRRFVHGHELGSQPGLVLREQATHVSDFNRLKGSGQKLIERQPTF
jgi:hypothetical protein